MHVGNYEQLSYKINQIGEELGFLTMVSHNLKRFHSVQPADTYMFFISLYKDARNVGVYWLFWFNWHVSPI